ncbi:MAG: acyl-CoA dehydrogenase family protein [Pseudomonadota bacterium]
MDTRSKSNPLADDAQPQALDEPHERANDQQAARRLARPTGLSSQGAAAVPDAHGLNLWRSDPAFVRLLQLYLPPKTMALIEPHLDELGRRAGGELNDLAMEADRHPPTLNHRTRRGEDRQTIAYHPAYRAMEQLAFGRFGLAAMSHRAGVFDAQAPLPPLAKYAFTYLFAQAEFGLLCPVNMTDSLTRTITRFADPALVARYRDGLTSQDLDENLQGAMFMTEQGAGSDIAATTVIARALDEGDPHGSPIGDARAYALHGEKWFCSNADADLALVLARLEGGPPGLKGVALFLLPRVLPDGTRNRYRIVRLKDKLGTRSMASGEITLEGATAWLVGAPDAGFKQMADMVNASRLSNGVRAAGMMRRCVFEALHVAHHREAFGRALITMPLMQRQLAKMLMRCEQARAMVLATADIFARADGGPHDTDDGKGDGASAGLNGDVEAAAKCLRILTPLVKFRACRDARHVSGDAMEVRGGCGYIEEWPEPKLLRDTHLGSIWEGTSNIVALDVLRAIKREHALDPLLAHLRARQAEAPLPHYAEIEPRVVSMLTAAQNNEALARSAASALYHLASATFLAWEGQRLGDPDRAQLAAMVVEHRLMPRDPLSHDNHDPTAGLEPLLRRAVAFVR